MDNVRKYRVYHYYNRPILAVPEDARYMFKMAWDTYHGFTFKRAIFRLSMQFAISLKIDKFFSSVTVNPFEPFVFRLDSWIAQVKTALDIDHCNILPVIIWPTDIRRGRVYINLLTEHGQIVGFCKISFNDLNDNLLDKEIESIKNLKKRNLEKCKVPTLLIDGLWEGRRYVVEEPIHVNRWPRYSKHAHMVKTFHSAKEEYKGVDRMVSPYEVKILPWWRRLEETAPAYVKLFLSELFNLICSCSGLPVQFVHGDLGPHNALWIADQLIIVDWEESSVNGPILTDEIGYDICINAKALCRKPKVVLRDFGLRYLHGATPSKVRDIMAALAFRRTVITSDTDIYIKHWDFLRSFYLYGEFDG